MNLRLDDLEIDNYKIYQDKDAFCFGIDSVILANFVLRMNNLQETAANADEMINICDICAGNIPIPLIIYSKSKKNIKITAYEIDKDSCELAQKSIAYNANDENGPKNEKILNDINVINIDLNEILNDKQKYSKLFDSFDIVTCNPPYIKVGAGIQNDAIKKIIARHEVKIDFDRICKIAYLLLKSKKKFYIVHRTNRLAEIIKILKKNNLEPKVIQFIYPNKNMSSNLFIMEARKDAKEETEVLSPIIVYNEKGDYTKEVLSIYGK